RSIQAQPPAYALYLNRRRPPAQRVRSSTPMRPFSRSSHYDVHFLKGSTLALNLNLIADMW
ncbi:hypothetical protein GFM44_39860, partial [Rhizobium leguminosarum bv. viciae]|nr:hypothetical protein [Rhizobium leguminosarum bv. viciae]